MLALGIGMGGARVPAMVSSVAGRGFLSSPQVKAFEAKQYPEEFAPQWYHHYEVKYSPSKRGKPNMNYMGKQNASIIDLAGRMQSLEEHNKALTKHLRPGQDIKQQRMALELGAQEEKQLPSFWNESQPRREFSVSSSAVSGIRLTPDARIEVRWGTGPKWYTFKQYENTYEAALAAQKLLKEDSIGRAVYPIISRPPKKPNPLLGGWNAENYDSAYA